jgi:hypothetical protein
MAQTVIRGNQILNNTVQRQDLDTSTVGQALVTKIVQGAGITLSSTGADSGTGDVTVAASVPAGPPGPAGPTGKPAYTNTSAQFTIPATGSTVIVPVNDTSWMTVGESVWVATAAGSGNAGTMKITAISPTQVTLQA